MSPRPLPKHVAIIMDGNGRWAQRRGLPRVMGHRAGVKVARQIVHESVLQGIEKLSLFAFSCENWVRPQDEVNTIFQLLQTVLVDEITSLDKQGIRLRILGDKSPLSATLKQRIEEAETLTAANDRLELMVALNYSGRWHISHVMQQLLQEVTAGELAVESCTEALIHQRLLADVSEPDLLIRTSGEHRISNFYLWHVAYTELYFTEVLWPEFTAQDFEQALTSFAGRERRYGATKAMENVG